MDPERRPQIENPFDGPLDREPSDRGKLLRNASDAETEPCSESLPARQSLARDRVSTHSRPPWWIYVIALAFACRAVFITYFCFFGPESMGIDVRPTKTDPVVMNVAPGSPADRAGIRPGDVLIRADDHLIRDINYWYWFLTNVGIGRQIVLEADRGGQRVHAAFTLKRRPIAYWFTGAGMILLLNICGQFSALAVALFVAFMRPRHLVALIGALFLAIYSTAVFMPYDGFDSMWRQSAVWLQALLWATNILNSVGLGIWFTFFALFPRPSFRKSWPWFLVWTPMLPLLFVFHYQVWHYIYSPENMIPSAWMSVILAAYWVAYLPGSFVLLLLKYRRLDETEKRRVRVIVFSLGIVTVLAVPVIVYRQPEYSEGLAASFFRSLPLGALATLAGVAFPLCFAYAILRHRLFDIRVIIRQGIRYAAAKQLLLVAAPALIAVFLTDIYARREERVDTIMHDRGWIYVGLAGLAVLAHARRQHWLESLDRRFFREQYDAQEVLRATLERVSAASSLAEVAPVVVKQIEAAMHPLFCAILQLDRHEKTYKVVSIYPEGVSPPALSRASRAVEIAHVVAKPVQLGSGDSWLARQIPLSEAKCFERSGVDLIAPVKGRASDALIVMGRKRSEEPYTSDDMRLVEDLSVGLALLPSRRPAEERFRLESRIAQGGMGSVYEATDLQLQRKVAIKLILDSLIADPAALERFQREARILASFQHPNVVTLFDVGVMPDGRPFLVMERLQGRTLRAELRRKPRLSSDEVRPIVRQLCAGLSAAHRRSLIHRDLKPENIFLCEDGAQGLVKILDFGLAKLLLETSAPAQTGTFSSLSGHIAGTPAYMSPEVLLGAKSDCSSDIWALALITCEMLTGEPALSARDRCLQESSFQGLPGCWCNFFNWSLADEPSQRPESIDAFLEGFERCAETALHETANREVQGSRDGASG